MCTGDTQQELARQGRKGNGSVTKYIGKQSGKVGEEEENADAEDEDEEEQEQCSVVKGNGK